MKATYKCTDCGHEQEVLEVHTESGVYVGSGAVWCDACGDGKPERKEPLSLRPQPPNIDSLKVENQRLRTESEERLQNCAALVAENERLRAEVTRPESTDMTLMRTLAQSQAAELERLRKDAERKPMTDEQIEKLFDRVRMRWASSPPTHEAVPAFARAVEAFHGIKETP